MAGGAQRAPTALLVVSAWSEGVPPRLAARITYTFDVTQSDRATFTAAGVDEIEVVVRHWLNQAAAASDRSGDGPVTEE